MPQPEWLELFGTLVAGLFHVCVVLFTGLYFDYDFHPEYLTRRYQAWMAVGAYAVGAVPAYLYFTTEAIAPVLVVGCIWVVVVRTEFRQGPGEPFGVIYAGLWPVILVLSILSFWFERVLFLS